MKTFVDENCIGCGTCVSMAPEIYEFNENGMAEAKDKELTEEEKQEVEVIINNCPVNAIHLEEQE